MLNLALRSYSFSLSVIDHDESTYILGGQTIFEGGQLYKDVIDAKPPGIFVIYYLNTFLFNDLIFGSRVMGWIAVSLIATLLCLFMKNLFNLRISDGIFTGIIFSMMMCYSFPGNINLTTYALDVNTEHFYILFLLISFLFIIRKKSLLDFGIAGFCFGIAFNISYAVFPHLIALSIFSINFNEIKQLRNISNNIKRLLILWGSFLIPFLSIGLYFFIQNRFNEYSFIAFEMTNNYLFDYSLIKLFQFFKFYFIRIWPVVILLIISSFIMLKKNDYRSKYVNILIWLSVSFITPLFVGQSLHYTYPLALPISVASTFSIIYFKNWNRYLYYSTISILIFMMVSSSYLRFKWKFNVPDKNRIIANELAEISHDKDLIHIDAVYHHIIYYLVGKKPITPYYHPPSLIYRYNVYQIDRKNEYQNIFNKKPKYVLVKGEPSSKIIDEYLIKDYSIEKTLFDDFYIYKINEDINIQS